MRIRRSVRPVHALAGLLLAAALALAGCSGAGAGDGTSSTAGKAHKADSADARGAAGSGAPKGAPGSGDGSEGGTASEPRATAPSALATSRIIRTASLTVRVKDVPKALDAARSTTENAGGYVGSETTTRDPEGREQTRVVLRVPVARYDQVLTGLQGTGRLIERTAQAQDVTDQVVDVDSRVRSQRASVARVRDLMDRATKLGDVVTLEGELSRREADLEALLAQQASLKDRTSLATITLSLSETPVTRAAAHDRPGFADALAGGWHAFATVLRWIALAVGAVLPFAVAGALVAVLWLRVVRPRLPRRTAAATAATAPLTTALGPFPEARRAPRSPAGGQESGGADGQD
jgi:hypothetical protein